MTDIQERLELAVKIKDHDLNLFRLARDKNEPDEEFRAAYIQQGQLLRQYREKYGREAEEQLRDQLADARKVYAEQYEAEEQMESQKGQIKELRQQLSEIDAVANAHAYEITDVKRRILDELYNFPVLELLDVLLELQKKHEKENDE